MKKIDIKKKVKLLWHAFKAANNSKDPSFVRVKIRWLSNGDEEWVTIKLSETVIKIEDAKIFFYLKGVENLYPLCDKKEEDFYIIDIKEFYLEL